MRAALLISVLVLVLALAEGAAGVAPTPALKVVRLAPFTARGVHFRAHERVKLVLTTGSDRLVRRVVADRLGAFRAKFAAAAIDRCSGYVLIARGADGSHTALKV